MCDLDIRVEWIRRVKPRVFARSRISLSPVSIFLGGQPGAGKTKTQKTVVSRYLDENITRIIGDDLRAFHPDYDWLCQNDPLRMPHVTAQASGQWIAMCIEWASRNSFSTLVEGTWRNTAMVMTEARKARELGRRTHAIIVAVPPVLSVQEKEYLAKLVPRLDEGIRKFTPNDMPVKVLVENIRKTLESG
ncbi:zeta toxin family protein [Actinotignum sanguinis]|uniref:zeta toxin family protein n=1 Tax=Actinotignum sanguinis TaxID=1445614 RepID=UPI0029347DFC|nr:zeta toxin family protein [Actinotignum sanguinis]MDV2437804.1 zeta toxin family protein [Actinotignum sanguinis]